MIELISLFIKVVAIGVIGAFLILAVAYAVFYIVHIAEKIWIDE